MNRQRISVGFLFVATIVGVAMFGSIALGAMISVPTDQSTIQDAINAWTQGDVIYIEPGIYHEDFSFGGTHSGNSRGITFETDTVDPAVLNGEITINHHGAGGNGNITFEGIIMGDDARVVIPSGLIVASGTMPGDDTDWFGLSISGHNLKVVGGPVLTHVSSGSLPADSKAAVIRFSSEGGGELYFEGNTWATAHDEAIAFDLDVKDGATLTHEASIAATALATDATAIALNVTGVDAGSEFNTNLGSVRATAQGDESEVIGINYDVAGGNIIQQDMDGHLRVEAEGDNSEATGIRYNTSAGGQVFIGDVADGGITVIASGDGSTAVGASYENTGMADLDVTQEAQVTATGEESATGIRFVSGHSDATGSLNLSDGVNVKAGHEAVGIDFSVAGEGVLAAADANINVEATEVGSKAVGVVANKSSTQTGKLDVTVGDVTVAGGKDVTGIDYSSARGGNIVAGDIWVTGRDADSEARGVVSKSTDSFGTHGVTVGDITVVGGALAEGINHSAQRGGTISSGDIDVEATEVGSEATGIMVELDYVMDPSEGITVDLQDKAVTVEAGAEATGINLNSNYGGSITGGPAINVAARDENAEATGVIAQSIHDTRALSVLLGDITVASGEAVGGVSVGGSATGVDYDSAAGGSLVIGGPVDVRSGDAATGVTYSSGADGEIYVLQQITAIATGNASEAIGADVSVDGAGNVNFSNIEVEGGEYAIGIIAGLGDGSTLRVMDITSTTRDDGATTEGAYVTIAGDVEATFGDVSVIALGDESDVYGVGYESYGGNVDHAADSIDVTAQGERSFAMGLDLYAIVDTTATVIGGITVEARGDGSDATGAWYESDLGARLDVTHTGDITVQASKEAMGIGAVIDHGSLTYEGELAVTAGEMATGIDFSISGDGAIDVQDKLTVIATADGSEAIGATGSAVGELMATFKDIEVEAGHSAFGIQYGLQDGGTMIAGNITVGQWDDNGFALGSGVGFGGDLGVSLGNVKVTVSGAGAGVIGAGYETMGGSLTHVSEAIDITASGDGAEAIGFALGTGGDITVDIVSPINVMATGDGSDAIGVFYESDTGAQLDVTHFGDITVDASKEALGIGVDIDHGSLTYEGELDVTAGEVATGIQFSAVDDGFLTVTGPVDVEAGEEAVGIELSVGNGEITAGNLTVTALDDDGSARGIAVGSTGDLDVMFGDVNATAAGTNSEVIGAWLEAAGALDANFGNIDVEGGDNAVGVALIADRVELTLDAGQTIDVLSRDDDATAFGVAILGDDISLTNAGIITVQADGDDAEATGLTIEAAISATIDNSSEIRAALSGDAAGIAIDASGSIGDVQLNHTGDIYGHVLMGDGDDTVVIQEGSTLTGSVLMGDGDDNVTMEYGADLIGRLDGGTGHNTLILEEGVSTDLTGFDWKDVGASWQVVLAENFGSGLIDGGAWAIADGTSLGDVIVDEAHLFIDHDGVTIDQLDLTAGSTLSGHGTITGNLSNIGSIVSAGSNTTYGVVEISGDYDQDADGELSVRVHAKNDHMWTPAVGGEDYDQLVVGGVATLANGTMVNVAPTFDPLRPHYAEYKLVDGDTVFDPDAINFVYDTDTRLFYEGKLEDGSVKLILKTVPFETVAQTTNQQAIAEALTSARENPATDLDDLYIWLYTLAPGDEDEARALFDSMVGDIYAQAPLLASRRMDYLSRAAVRKFGEDRDNRHIWASAYGDSGEVMEDAQTPGVEYELNGIVAGMEFAQTKKSQFGFLIGGGNDTLTMVGNGAMISGNGYQIGAYGRFDTGRIRYNLILGHGQNTLESIRFIKLGGTTHVVEGSFKTTDTLLSAEARMFPFGIADLHVEPLASVGVFHTRQGGFSEVGAGTFGLEVNGLQGSWVRGRVGFLATWRPPGPDNRSIIPHFGLTWVNDFARPDSSIGVGVAGLPGAALEIEGMRPNDSGFVADFGLTATTGKRLIWNVAYRGEFRDDSSTSHLMEGRLSIKF